MKKIKFVTGLHGNEVMPIVALTTVDAPQIIANKAALAQRERFIELDMNKAFGTMGNTVEEERAREVLEEIKSDELVVDFHTTAAITEPFVIIVDLEMLDFAQTAGLKRIVYMKHNIKGGHALINLRDGISIETGQHDTAEAFKNTLKVYESIRAGIKHPATLYEVYDIEARRSYINFEPHPDGFVPVLAGETSYPFASLKARVVKKLTT